MSKTKKTTKVKISKSTRSKNIFTPRYIIVLVLALTAILSIGYYGFNRLKADELTAQAENWTWVGITEWDQNTDAYNKTGVYACKYITPGPYYKVGVKAAYLNITREIWQGYTYNLKLYDTEANFKKDKYVMYKASAQAWGGRIAAVSAEHANARYFKLSVLSQTPKGGPFLLKIEQLSWC